MGNDVLLIAQPRLLAPKELVALDLWVRAGGRAIIFADPALVWPSRFVLGDARRAPPVTLLDPLLTHWGLTLEQGTGGVEVHRSNGFTVAVESAGEWRAPTGCKSPDPIVADCVIGRGRAVLVADADVLNPELWKATGAQNREWLQSLVVGTSGGVRDSTRLGRLVGGLGAVLALIAGSVAVFRRRRLRT